MNRDRKSQQQLADEVEELAAKAHSNRRLGENYILQSNARLIHSNARVEGVIGNLINEIKNFNEKSGKQANEMVKLTRAIVGLTVLLLIGLGIQIWLQLSGS